MNNGVKVKYNLVNFDDDAVLDVHLNLVGMEKTAQNRRTLRVMRQELALLFGKEKIRHQELEAYVSQPLNIVRLI